MGARSFKDAWEIFGRTDPYYGVLNAPRFREAARPGAARDAFFGSGEQHVEKLFADIRGSLEPTFAPRRALDFGCGVGRGLLPLARRVPEVVGVDISPSMLREARKNCDEAGLANVALLSSEQWRASPVGPFDLIHSYIVFQHIPPREGMAALRELLARLSEDGVGALHFVYASTRPRWRTAVHWLRKRAPLVHPALNLVQGRALDSPLMQMNAYSLDAVFAALQRSGCHRVAVRFSDHDGWLGAFVLFQRRPDLDLRVT